MSTPRTFGLQPNDSCLVRPIKALTIDSGKDPDANNAMKYNGVRCKVTPSQNSPHTGTLPHAETPLHFSEQDLPIRKSTLFKQLQNVAVLFCNPSPPSQQNPVCYTVLSSATYPNNKTKLCVSFPIQQCPTI